MVKGVCRQVIVVKGPDPRLFEQAIFILKEDAVKEGITDEALLKEAERLNGITFFPQEPPYLLSITIYRKIKLYRLQRHL